MEKAVKNETRKINSWDELKSLRAKAQKEAQARAEKTVIAVGMGTCGAAAGANETLAALKEELKRANKLRSVEVVVTGCYGFCFAEPLVEIREPGKESVRYGNVDGELARFIVRKHIENHEVLEDAVVRMEVRRA